MDSFWLIDFKVPTSLIILVSKPTSLYTIINSDRLFRFIYELLNFMENVYPYEQE